MKLQRIIDRINLVPIETEFEKIGKELTIAFYTLHAKQLESISIERIDEFSFTTQIKQEAFVVERMSNLRKVCYKLERHLYAPEMNKLHFLNNTTYTVSGVTEIEAGLRYAALNMSDTEYNKSIKPVLI